MLIVMQATATDAEITAVVRVITELGYKAHVMPGPTRTAIGITGNEGPVDQSHFEGLAGVQDAIRVTKPYKLISRELHPQKSIVKVGDAIIGGDQLTLIAGPCVVENRKDVFAVADTVSKSGARFFFGSAVRPGTWPYIVGTPQAEVLQILADIRSQFALKIVSEAVDEKTADFAEDHYDAIQIGSRNMQNFPLLRHVGRSRIPVILKRSVWATVDEWLLAAEYIMVEGNYNVVLCERGIRTFNEHANDTLDFASIPAVRQLSHLPLLVDPAESSDRNYLIRPLSCAAVAAGADGLILEVRKEGESSLALEQYQLTVAAVRAIYDVVAHAA